MAELICEECRESVASKQVSACPHCGHDPGDSMRSQARWRLGVGMLLCMTIVGAVLGIPLVISGLRRYGGASDATPAVSPAAG